MVYEDHEENGHKVRPSHWYENDKQAPSNLTIYTEPLFYGGPSSPTGVFTGAVTTAYDAQFTTVTDQAGKVRRSMVDGIGRLVRVDEPDANGSLGSTTAPVQPTTYGYDVFGNLTSVTQGLQTRTFTYDSLSRLRTAINPESGTIGYQYDDNGNLLVKTDARGASAHFDYDSLNRVTRRWYNGSSMSDNNGNLQKQDVYIPNDDLISGYTQRWQQYDYDNLNRLTGCERSRTTSSSGSSSSLTIVGAIAPSTPLSPMARASTTNRLPWRLVALSRIRVAIGSLFPPANQAQ